LIRREREAASLVSENEFEPEEKAVWIGLSTIVAYQQPVTRPQVEEIVL
jgi:chromosome segregation and condensation protein ScpB